MRISEKIPWNVYRIIRISHKNPLNQNKVKMKQLKYKSEI